MKKRLLVKNAYIIDVSSEFHRKKVDILLEDDLITRIENAIDGEFEVFDASGYCVSPGFIDSHVHCYYGPSAIGIRPSSIGRSCGVTSMIDAGSSGAGSIDDFYEKVISQSEERVFVLLNTATEGLKTLSELSHKDAINETLIQEAIKKYPNHIVGLKARASASVVKDLGIEPIRESKRISSALKMPLVVHIGNMPPKIEEVLALMEKDDVITHCYHNKPNGLFDGQVLKAETKDCLKKGVKFDIGHGASSFAFSIYDLEGFEHDFISSDIYDKNIDTVVKSLVHVMNKVIKSKEDIDQVIAMVTSKVASQYQLDKLGSIALGNYGDLTLFNLNENDLVVEDSVGEARRVSPWIEAKYTIMNGCVKEVNYSGGSSSFTFLKEGMNLSEDQLVSYLDELRYIEAVTKGEKVTFSDLFKLGFYSHMIALIDRLRKGEKLETVDAEIRESISDQAYGVSKRIVSELSSNYQVEVDESEVLLASIHIQTALSMEE